MEKIDKVFGCMLLIAIVFAMYVISFGITSAIIYGICWAFELKFSFKIAFGIWLVLILIKRLFNNKTKN